MNQIKKNILFVVLIICAVVFWVGVNANKTSDVNEQNIEIHPLMELSGKSRAEIYDLRSDAVKTSEVFSSLKKYSPNPYVFMITDGKQWISAHQLSCYGNRNNLDIGKGASSHSMGVLNPELLFYPSVPVYEFSRRNIPCTEVDYFMPYKMTYNPQRKRITAYVNYTDFLRKNKDYYTIYLANANARDLGYNHIFVSKISDARLYKTKELMQKVTSPTGFYHLGGSCGLKEGCNNYSPTDAKYFVSLNRLPAEIHFKLWKNKPITKYQKADLTFKLIFD